MVISVFMCFPFGIGAMVAACSKRGVSRQEVNCRMPPVLGERERVAIGSAAMNGDGFARLL